MTLWLIIAPRNSSAAAYCCAGSARRFSTPAGAAPSPRNAGLYGACLTQRLNVSPAPLDEVQQLRHRIRAILRVQQRVGQRRLLPEVRRLAQQARQRMSGRQRAERGDEIADLVVRGRMPMRRQNSCSM